jgi:hypothetical protein
METKDTPWILWIPAVDWIQRICRILLISLGFLVWRFLSKDEPSQWVCWDFRQIRVRPVHYTLVVEFLKSWVVEGSLDGRSWTEIDRQTYNQDFKARWQTGCTSFPVSKPVEFRFIRLTQTDKNYCDDDVLYVYAVEFFGTLSE